jgi:hypothetical protein
MSVFIESVRGQINQAAILWEKDLRAHDPSRLTDQPTDSVRSVADIAWESVVINHRIAARLRGESPAPAGDGFPSCPTDLANTAALVAAIAESTQAVLDAMGDDETRMVQVPSGSENAIGYAMFAAIHMFYHLGQVNYVQTTYGDVDVHWF